MRKTGKQLVGILLALALVLQLMPAGPGTEVVKAAGETSGETGGTVSVAAPVFSHGSGNYEDAFDLTLSSEAGTKIYYSTDGSVPSPEKVAGGSGGAGSFTSEKCEVPVTYDNVKIPDAANYSESSEGIVIEPSGNYHNISFAIPAKYSKIVKVKSLHVVARIDSISNPSGGSRVKLQTALVKKNATHSYQEADGSYTRLSGTDQTKEAVYTANGGFVDYTFALSNSMSPAGFVMVGAGQTTNTGGYITKMTVKSIYFEIDLEAQKEEGATAAQIYEYKDKISVHDRTGEKNVLATVANSVKFAQTKPYTANDAQVAKSTVIRAMAVDAAGNCSPVVTKTYFVGTNLTTRYGNTPVLSLATDPENLVDDETGIFIEGNHSNYTQHGPEWEREAYADFYDVDGKIDFATNVGIRVHGGYTRQYQQKSLNVYFREEYGMKNLKYELIPGATNYEGTKATKKYKSFVLRNGGNDAFITKTRDAYIQSRVADRNIAVQSSRPCIVYLNGEYWGVYNIQEKYGDNWLEEEFGVNKNNVVLIKDGEVDEGTEADMALFDELKALAKLDMSKTENYQKFLDAVDIQSYLDYYATEILIGNRDWGLHKNNQFWRSRTVTNTKYEDGKWRWLLHDTEYSMNLYNIDPKEHTSEDSIAVMKGSAENHKRDPLFVALLANSQFKQAFINTVMDLLNENFNYDNYWSDYEAFCSVYKTLMPEQNERFGTDWENRTDMSCFTNSINGFNAAWKGMESRMMNMLETHLSAKNTATLYVSTNVAKQADMAINTLKEEVGNGIAWSGTYYKEAPVRVAAPEIEGYTFSNWEVSGGTIADKTAVDTRVTLTADSASVRAVYKKAEGGQPSPSTAPTGKPTVTVKPTDGPTVIVKPTGKPTVTAKPTDKPTVTVKPVVRPTSVPKNVKPVKAPKKAVIKKVTSPKKKTIKVKIKKQAADGFEIVYARNKKCTKSKKKVRTTKCVKTIKKLKRKKTYYVKVRAYRKKSDGKRVYGKFSKVKRIKVK